MIHLTWILPIIVIYLWRTLDWYFFKKRCVTKTDSNLIKWPIGYPLFFGISAVLAFGISFWSLLGFNLLNVFIGFIIVALFMTFWFLYLLLYKVYVFEDKLVFITLFKKRIINYNEAIITSDEHSTKIKNLSGKEIVRITSFLDYNDLICKHYNKYYKSRKIQKPKTFENTIRPNYYVKYSSITFIIISLVLLIFSVISFWLNWDEAIKHINELIILVTVFGFIFLVALISGIVMLLYYLNWRVALEKDCVIKKSLFGKIKSFDKRTVSSVEETNVFYKAKDKNGKVVLKVLIHICDNSELMDDL